MSEMMNLTRLEAQQLVRFVVENNDRNQKGIVIGRTPKGRLTLQLAKDDATTHNSD